MANNRTRFKLIGALMMAMLCLGCRDAKKQLQFVFPNGFNGAFAIVQRRDGAVLARSQTNIEIRVPPSRIVELSSFEVFNEWRSHSAVYSDGKPIPVYEPKDDEVALRSNGLVGRNGVERMEFFVGTMNDFRAFKFDDWARDDQSSKSKDKN
jgi:hypothetical protein